MSTDPASPLDLMAKFFKKETVRLGDKEAIVKLQPTGDVELCFEDKCYDVGLGEQSYANLLAALQSLGGAPISLPTLPLSPSPTLDTPLETPSAGD